MIIIISLIYVACVLVAFRVIKIKVSATSVAVAAFIGVIMLGGVVTVWNLGSPVSDQMTLRRTVVRITPNEREFVSKVHVRSNDLVEKGQPLFEISRERFQNAVDQVKASLAAAQAKVSQLEASVQAAEASVEKAVADTGVAEAQLATAEKLRRSSPGAVAKLRIAEAKASFSAAQANTEASRASLKQAQSSLEAARFAVEVAEASLNKAQYNLSQTIYRSPVDGRVINFQIREQTPVARWQFTSVGTIMDLSDNAVLAIYPQNLLKHVAPGDDVEIAFRRHPGTIATGKVQSIVKYTGEGQFAATDRLPVVATVGSKGFLAVRILLDDEELARTLPLGAAGAVAIYTKFGGPFHVISKIVVRMKGWLYYLPV